MKPDLVMQHGDEAAGMPIMTETFTRNAAHIAGRIVHRRNGQFIIGYNHRRAIFNVNLTLTALRTAIFAMQKIIETRLPMLFFEPRTEYVPAVRRLATTWRQLYSVGGWPAGSLTNKEHLGPKNNKTNMFKESFYPCAAFCFSTRGNIAATMINECHHLEIPIFGIVNSSQHHPEITYSIPMNDVSGSSYQLLMSAMQGMMVRADVLQKRKLFNAILQKAKLYRKVRQDVERRINMVIQDAKMQEGRNPIYVFESGNSSENSANENDENGEDSLPRRNNNKRSQKFVSKGL